MFGVKGKAFESDAPPLLDVFTSTSPAPAFAGTATVICVPVEETFDTATSVVAPAALFVNQTWFPVNGKFEPVIVTEPGVGYRIAGDNP